MREVSSACLALPAPQKPSRDCCGLQGAVFQHRSRFAHTVSVLCCGQQLSWEPWLILWAALCRACLGKGSYHQCPAP